MAHCKTEMSEFYKRLLSSVLLIPLATYFLFQEKLFFLLFIAIIFIISAYEWYKLSSNKSIFFFGFIFLIFSFICIYKLRFFYINNKMNIFTIYYALIVCISTDIGGYVFGKLIKGPKLIKFSPKKTYAGLIGGIFLSIIFSQIFVLKFDYLFKVEVVFSYNLIIFTLLISLVSQFGDIIISIFKRKKGIKDTGKLIPGHGGLLDRIDGMIFAFPFVYIFISLNNFI